MSNKQAFEKSLREVRAMLRMIVLLFLAISGVLLFLLFDPDLSSFKSAKPAAVVSVQDSLDQGLSEADYDAIENGIHLRTGFVEAEGLMTVVNNCTNCHSAKLVTQNRMTREGWEATIRWMQETQKLWDLGNNEAIILDYLAANYAPEDTGRRANLADIEWYVLED